MDFGKALADPAPLICPAVPKRLPPQSGVR